MMKLKNKGFTSPPVQSKIASFLRFTSQQRRPGMVSGCPPSLNGLPSRPHTPSVVLLSQSAYALSSSFAFTLAEVLITLAIIGVVTALTIPTVVRNYQKQQTVVRLKKAYSAISNTTNLAMADHGPIAGWVVENGKAEDFANTYLVPYLKVSKNCGTKITDECDFSFKRQNGNTTKLGANSTKFYLNDGVFIGVSAMNTISSGVLHKQADIFIDINGQKKPNLIGKDVFHFLYFIYWEGNPSITGKLGTYGSNDRNYNLHSSDPAVCNTGGTGEYCTRVIMQDGWEIRDDYPW